MNGAYGGPAAQLHAASGQHQCTFPRSGGEPVDQPDLAAAGLGAQQHGAWCARSPNRKWDPVADAMKSLRKEVLRLYRHVALCRPIRVHTDGWIAMKVPSAPDRAGAPEGLSSGEIFATYQERIRRYVLGMVHDPAEAEDLTQEVFIQVHRRLDSLRDPDALVAWLYRIATRVCYDRFRKSSRQPQTETLEDGEVLDRISADDTGGAASLDRVIERAEMSACVRKYMEDLSPEYRQVIVLHDLEQLSNPEIAEHLGVSLDTVKIRLHRARRKLQAVLEAQCDFSVDDQGVFVCEQAEVAPAETSPGSTDCATRK